MAVQEATWSVVLRDGLLELCDHAPRVVAETVVAGGFAEAGLSLPSRPGFRARRRPDGTSPSRLARTD